MKRIGNLITFLVLSVTLLINGAPRDFLHTFAHHQDTVDKIDAQSYSDHHAAFDVEHHHCDFLHLTIPVYHPIEEDFQLPSFKEPAFVYEEPKEFRLFPEEMRSPNRGPPLC